jgi:mono/diheme cytochrome c family protein
MTWRVVVSTIAVVLTMIIFGYVAVTEQNRMAGFDAAYQARQIEVGAALFENNCRTCHGPQGKGIEGVAPGLNAPDLFDGSRLKQIGYPGTVADYVRATISGGRPRASADFANYPQRMPTWSQTFGGPLRADQINSLVAFVMNWGTAYQTAGGATPVPAVVGVGTDITVTLPAGNAEAGKALAESKGCTGCHILSAAGPAWLAAADPNGQGAGTRAANRIKAQDYTGKATTPEQYLFEAIVAPGAYLVPGASYQASGKSIMPGNFGNTLDQQNMADLIAYLLTVK